MSDDKPRWQQSGAKRVVPPAAKRVTGLLEQLKAVLEQQLAAEQKQVRAIQEQLHRAKHGGGS